MSTGPVPYRLSSSQQYVAAFPPATYYRDTYGLQDSYTTDGSDTASITTKSTVRTLNYRTHTGTYDSATSKETHASQSYQIEQVVTSKVVIISARPLLTLALIALASAIQLLLFGVICVFYDGCPHLTALWCAILFIGNALLLIAFVRVSPTRRLLFISLIASSCALLLSIGLFIWTAILVDREDKLIRASWKYSHSNVIDINRIITNTKIAMYSLLMILTPIHAICCAAAIVLLYRNVRAIRDEAITKAYFFSEPSMGHQTVLVPIELKQVKNIEPESVEQATIAVQTSATSWT